LKEKSTCNNKLLEYKVYLDERKSLFDAIRDSRQHLDKAILSLSAGALAISLTFVHEIAPHPIKSTLFYLFISWFLFIFSILSTLISFMTSEKACIKQIDIMEKDIVEEDHKARKGKEKYPTNPWSNITRRINYLSMASFIMGLSFLVVFSIINVKTKEEEYMSKKNSTALQNPKPLNPDSGMEPIKPPLKPPQNPTKK